MFVRSSVAFFALILTAATGFSLPPVDPGKLTAETAQAVAAASQRRIAPLSDYVEIGPVSGGSSEGRAVALDKADLARLVVRFQRDSLGVDDGVQFARITVTITRPDGTLHDKIVEKAFTFARDADAAIEQSTLQGYARAIHPLGFASRRKIDSVEIDLGDVPDWAFVEVRVDPDPDFAAYAYHRGNRVERYYRARGRRIDGALYLGIPQVLADSRPREGLDYGRTSAMYRLFWLDAETGTRFPVNVGFGVFGVRSPIDVSSRGGGFACSAFLDVFEVARLAGLELTTKVNAGIEVVPFLPVDRPARVLLALRVGIAP